MRFYHPVILFLDDDLEKSAQALTSDFLDVNIRHAQQVLFDALFYFVGIRSKKFYDHYFNKDNKKDSIEKWFPSFPRKKKFPGFSFYNSVESRWTRMCLEHFQYMSRYFECMIREHEYRTGHEHDLTVMVDFFNMIPLNMTLTSGIRIPSAHLEKITIPWKNLAPQYRKKDIVEGYRKYYRTLVYDPLNQYADTGRDIPEWVFHKTDLAQEIM